MAKHHLWPDHTGPNAIPFVFRIGIWVFGERTDHIREAYIRLHTDAYGMAFSSSKHLLCMFKIIFIDHPNVASMCIREVFGKHFRSIRHVRKTFGKHASSSWCIQNENLDVLGSVCFPNTANEPRTSRMLSEPSESMWKEFGPF